jgi:hypothetical protein
MYTVKRDLKGKKTKTDTKQNLPDKEYPRPR